MTGTYKIILLDAATPTASGRNELKAKIAEQFGISSLAVDTLFKRLPATLLRDLSEEEAGKMCTLLKSIGALVNFELEIDGKSSDIYKISTTTPVVTEVVTEIEFTPDEQLENYEEIVPYDEGEKDVPVYELPDTEDGDVEGLGLFAETESELPGEISESNVVSDTPDSGDLSLTFDEAELVSQPTEEPVNEVKSSVAFRFNDEPEVSAVEFTTAEEKEDTLETSEADGLSFELNSEPELVAQPLSTSDSPSLSVATVDIQSALVATEDDSDRQLLADTDSSVARDHESTEAEEIVENKTGEVSRPRVNPFARRSADDSLIEEDSSSEEDEEENEDECLETVPLRNRRSIAIGVGLGVFCILAVIAFLNPFGNERRGGSAILRDPAKLEEILQRQQAQLQRRREQSAKAMRELPAAAINWKGTLGDKSGEGEVKFATQEEKLLGLTLTFKAPLPEKLTPQQVVAGARPAIWLKQLEVEHFEALAAEPKNSGDNGKTEFKLHGKAKAYLQDNNIAQRILSDIEIRVAINFSTGTATVNWIASYGDSTAGKNMAEHVNFVKRSDSGAFILSYRGQLNAIKEILVAPPPTSSLGKKQDISDAAKPSNNKSVNEKSASKPQ